MMGSLSPLATALSLSALGAELSGAQLLSDVSLPHPEFVVASRSASLTDLTKLIVLPQGQVCSSSAA